MSGFIQFTYLAAGAVLVTVGLVANDGSKPLWFIAGLCAMGVATLEKILNEVRK